MPIFTQVGRALYDVAGWIPVEIDGRKVAQAIGIELKSTKQRHPSLPIISADGSGSGVQAHQLEALASIHRDGGIARLMWSNGGVIGVMDGDEIAHTFFSYGVSLAAEKAHKTPARGSRSVPWGLFREVDLVNAPWGVLIPPAREPTLSQTAAAARRKAAKLIDKAAREEAERQDAGQFVGTDAEEEEQGPDNDGIETTF
jgi:hypothetical protein